MSNLTKLGLAVTAAAVATAAFAGGKPAAQNGGVVRTDSAIANNLLTPQVGTMRELAVLKMRQKSLADQALYLGGIVRGTVAYSRLSSDQSRSANTHARVTNGAANKKTASQINMPQVDMIGVANLNSWTTGVLEYGAQNVGRTSGGSDNLGLQQAYVILGDLNSSSVFGFMGKKDVDFGNFTSVNFNAQPLNKRAFEVGAKNSVGVGFDASGFSAVATLMNGDNSSANLNNTAYTSKGDNINNLALNLAYAMNNNGVDWGVGAGWLNGSRYNYRKVNNKNNGAWDVNGHFTVKNLHVLAEYNRTSGKPTGYNDNIAAYNVGAMYGFPLMGHNSAVNASYSHVADKNTSAKQFVLGWNNELYNNVWMGLEWAYNRGGVNGSDSMATATDAVSGLPGATNTKDNTLTLNLTATF